MAGWLSCATAIIVSHTFGWDSSRTRQVIFGIFVAYNLQPAHSNVCLYDLAWKGLQYTLSGLVVIQLLRCLPAVTSTTIWTGPGRVLLFPCKATHSRLPPKDHILESSYPLVGIPVGWEGVAGGLVSSSSRKLPWYSLSNTCWFKVNAADHLGRGNSRLGLRGKLDAYLRTEVCSGSLETQ